MHTSLELSAVQKPHPRGSKASVPPRPCYSPKSLWNPFSHLWNNVSRSCPRGWSSAFPWRHEFCIFFRQLLPLSNQRIDLRSVVSSLQLVVVGDWHSNDLIARGLRLLKMELLDKWVLQGFLGTRPPIRIEFQHAENECFSLWSCLQ